MDEILKIDTIDRYNKLFGFETRHPLVGVVRFDTAESQGNYRMTMGFYSVFLKETRGCTLQSCFSTEIAERPTTKPTKSKSE